MVLFCKVIINHISKYKFKEVCDDWEHMPFLLNFLQWKFTKMVSKATHSEKSYDFLHILSFMIAMYFSVSNNQDIFPIFTCSQVNVDKILTSDLSVELDVPNWEHWQVKH